jgi:hypothetical protein
LISPHANSGFSIISKTRSTSVFIRFPIPARPENVAFHLIREDAVESGTVCSTHCFLQVDTVATFDIVEVVAVLSKEFRVRSVESETVSAGLQLGSGVLAFPVFVTGTGVRVESVFMWTFKRFLTKCWKNIKVRLIN